MQVKGQILKTRVLILMIIFVTTDGLESKNKGCVLPEHPKNGRWTISTSFSKSGPGQKVASGTIINATCDNYYENSDQTMSKCINGKWSLETKELRCVPTCGVKPKPTKDTKVYYPWNVAIYRTEGETKTFQCAGSLISERIILTAGHCLSDHSGQKFSVHLYKVAAGKSSALYTDAEDLEAQYSDVEDMFLPEQFQGATGKYLADIGVIVTKTAFNMSDRIQPVCYDWNRSFSKDIDYLKTEGYIPGPLKSQYFPQLEEIFEIEVPFVSDTQCYRMLEGDDSGKPSFESYFTRDKICAGYINSDMVPLCRVDPGIGLVIKNQQDNKYYVTGLVSLFNSVFYHTDSCDNQRWLLFTRLSEFSNFILQKTKLYL